MQHFPAIIIGGPPNSGKSILTANLTQALRQRGCQHYVLRACPDGEGDWTQLADQELVHTMVIPRNWTPEFVTRMVRDIEQRHLPLLVDVGGRPRSWQRAIFDACTHAILITPDAASAATWHDMAEQHHLVVIADIHSDLHGASRLDATSPVIRGTLAGLEWGQVTHSPLFEALVNRLNHDLFAYDASELRRLHLDAAPVEVTIDLDRLAHTLGVPFEGAAPHWTRHHISSILNYLPEATPLALYGRGTNWIYAAVALLSLPEPFFQFDPRRGWVQAMTLRTGAASDQPLQIQELAIEGGVHLAGEIPQAYLDYEYLPHLIVPAIPPDQGILLSGKLPHWLYTSLARTYRAHPWIAIYQLQLAGAAVVHTTTAAYTIGDLLLL